MRHYNPRLLAGLAAAFLLFHVTAAALGSDRGQWGLLVALIVVTATIAVERALLPVESSTVIAGFRAPAARGLAAGAIVSGLLIAVVPIAAHVGGWTLAWRHDVLPWVPGLFAQAGIAEETLFRAFLFGHLRETRSFRHAALLSVPPFAAVHVLLFWTMPWPIALTSIVLAVVTSFPLAYLFELGGRTIWAPALLHFVIQGTVKIADAGGDGMTFALIWMAASGVVPFLVFAFKGGRRRGCTPPSAPSVT